MQETCNTTTGWIEGFKSTERFEDACKQVSPPLDFNEQEEDLHWDERLSRKSAWDELVAKAESDYEKAGFTEYWHAVYSGHDNARDTAQEQGFEEGSAEFYRIAVLSAESLIQEI